MTTRLRFQEMNGHKKPYNDHSLKIPRDEWS